MTSSNSLPLGMLSEIEQSCQLLRRYSCLDVGSRSSDPDPGDPQQQKALENDWHQLRAALRCVVNASEYQILGICADTLAQGLQALKSYAAALNYPNVPSLAPMEGLEGSVYIKFNPNTQLCYASPYSGEHRGVLVSCQSVDESNLNEMFGHLPLDLFVQ